MTALAFVASRCIVAGLEDGRLARIDLSTDA
jgi:hypothetical protein